MTPRPPPKNLVTTLTKAQVKKLANEQAKRVFGRTAAEVVRGVRDGSIPKNAAATNITMLFSLVD